MNTTLPSRRTILQLACATTATLSGMTMTNSVFAQATTPAVTSATSTINQLRILCSGPAGSIPDIVARRVAEQLTRHYPQGAIVDNRPGAAGQIAVNALKAAVPDGSTVLLAQGAVATVYPYLYTKLAYDPIADLQPISMAGEMTLALAVGPAVPNNVTNLEEFIGWMRANPKLANVAAPGTGTLPHLLEVMLFREANVPWQHVVYAGGPPAMIDLLGGQVAALVLPEGARYLPASIGPPETNTDGMFRRIEAINMPGVILSQLEMHTMASAQCAFTIYSTLSAIISRDATSLSRTAGL